MAYLFGAANVDVIDCGAGVAKAATFSVFARFWCGTSPLDPPGRR
jgi:hypothetical protein